MSKDKKNWLKSSRQFSHIMCDVHQTPRCFHLFKASQMEPSKAHIVFDMAKDSLHLHTSFRSQLLALIRCQILTILLAKFHQPQANLDVPVAFGFGTFAFERTFIAALCPIMASLTLVTIIGLVFAGVKVR